MFQSKKNNKTKGTLGEQIATTHLVKKGHRILANNWRFGRTEIDIVSEYQQFIVFTEVKLRTPDTLVEPQLAVNRKKQKTIIKAADAWLKEHEIDQEARFDIITIITDTGKRPVIEHYEDAYYAIA